MKESGRIQSAIDIHARIDHSRIPMDNTIRDYMAQRRYIGSKDRSDIVERVYRIVRHQARIGWHIERAGMALTPRARMIACLMLCERKTPETVSALFGGGKYEPAPPDAAEESLIGALAGQPLEPDAMPETVRAECPPWAEERLRVLFGTDFLAQMRAMQDAAPLDLRVNTLLADVDTAQASLAEQRVVTTKTPYSPIGLRAPNKTFMNETKAFRKGMVEIQDEGSQLIALACAARPGMRVLDFCAGGGGKTLGIAAAMENKGNIVAMDIDPRRLEKGRQRYRKAGVHNVELRCLEDEQHRKWLRRQKATMDVVLVDAPCSSSGTWRRNPDLRWRQYGPSLDEIKTMQADILEKVADKVKQGGRLVYATCSLFREENEEQVEKFLSLHDDFEIIPISQAFGEGVTAPSDGPYLRLYPMKNNTDGFFTAVLRRK